MERVKSRIESSQVRSSGSVATLAQSGGRWTRSRRLVMHAAFLNGDVKYFDDYEGRFR